MMQLDMIMAIAANGVIGDRGRLPWRLPADLRYFRERTLGRAVIMGRATWESLPHALPERKNIVLSRTPDFVAEGADLVCDAASALAAAKAHGSHEPPMIIGGAAIYRLFEPQVRTIYLTLVDAKPKGDTYYTLDEDRWQEAERSVRPRDERNPYDLTFLTLQRRSLRQSGVQRRSLQRRGALLS